MAKSTTISPRFAELQRRIRTRLMDLPDSPTTLAVRHGLGRDFIRDLIQPKPRKKGVWEEHLPKLAAALDVDVAYLTLHQPEPRKLPSAGVTEQTLAFGGICEPGVWRAAPYDAKMPPVPTLTLEGVNLDTVYVQKGETLAGIGIHDGFILYAERGATAATGDVVILRRNRDELIEVTAQVKTGAGYELRPSNGTVQPITVRPKTITVEEAVVRVAQKLFR